MGLSKSIDVSSDQVASGTSRPYSALFFVVFCLIASCILSEWLAPKVGIPLFAISVFLVWGVSLVTHHVQKYEKRRYWLIPFTIAVLISILIFTRAASLSPLISQLQLDLFGSILSGGKWVGLSYLVFRLIHVLLDSKRQKPVATVDLITYALFPPTLIAGPIHRLDRFIPQLLAKKQLRHESQWLQHFWRIGLGTTKKLFLANAFAVYALTPEMITNPAITPLFLWLALIAYALMIYFDFAGYSDIAIGVAGLVGISIPENFANPYMQPNIALFWRSWHITLSNWLRDYIFFPTSRSLLARLGRTWQVPVMALAYIVTMLIAGLWHGFTTGFIVWGLWHGLGLFVYTQWHEFATKHSWEIPYVLSVLLTFVFVLLGWAFFALPTANEGLYLLGRLFGR